MTGAVCVALYSVSITTLDVIIVVLSLLFTVPELE